MPGACDRRAMPRNGMHRRPEWRSYFRTGPNGGDEPRTSATTSRTPVRRLLRMLGAICPSACRRSTTTDLSR